MHDSMSHHMTLGHITTVLILISPVVKDRVKTVYSLIFIHTNFPTVPISPVSLTYNMFISDRLLFILYITQCIILVCKLNMLYIVMFKVLL